MAAQEVAIMAIIQPASGKLDRVGSNFQVISYFRAQLTNHVL